MTSAALTALLVLMPVLASATQATATRPKPGAIPDRAALLEQAAEAQRAGRTEDAMRAFRLAAEKHQSVQAYLELARLQSRGGDASGAMASLSKAREIAPNSEDVLSAYAQLSLAVKQPLPAVLALKPLTRVYPTVAQYHYLLGVGMMALGDMTSATEALNEANRLEPDRPLTLLAMGLAFNNRKLFAEAQSALSRSLDREPESTDAVAALAEAEAGLGNFDRAAQLAKRALERSPDSVTGNLVMGMVLIERRQYAEARDALLKAAASDSDSPKVVYQLSLAYARLGDEANARRYVDLYQEKLRGVEERLKMLRAGGALTKK